MTRRPLLWIAAVAVILGVVAWAPSASGAQLLAWTVTVDPYDGPVVARDVPVTGTATTPLGTPASTVTVELVPLFDECGAGPQRSTVEPAGDGRYRAVVATRCNGPYEIRVTAESLGSDSGVPTVGRVGVAEKPGAPGRPDPEDDGTGPHIAWTTPSSEVGPDAAGWVVTANGADAATVGPEVTEVDLPAQYSGQVLALKALRWGAEGPGKSTVASDASPEVLVVPSGPATEPPPPDPPSSPSSTPSPSGGAGPGGGTPPPGSTTPPTSTTRVPSRGTGSDQPLPEGYSEELPYGVPDDSFVPGETSDRSSGQGDEESATGTSPAGLVRTSEKTSPGLVAPFALGLMMITIAAHIAWYLRRSKTIGDAQQVIVD